MSVINQQISLPLLEQKKVKLSVKRLDLAHPTVSGNKYYKLKLNLNKAQQQGFKTLLTFGGAFSNHILATAEAGRQFALHTIGIIRGEELVHQWKENPTLKKASEAGMHFKFVSRADYRQKDQALYLEDLSREFGKFYHLPEGGTNELAIKGCEEIITRDDKAFDCICCSVGTGGTLAGLVNASAANQRIIGFASLNNTQLKEDICKFTAGKNWVLLPDYHFGGYAKVTQELVEFINWFNRETSIPLDPVYTGKLLFGLLNQIERDGFQPGTSILAIHSGGLQGIEGMNRNLKKKKLPQIII